MIYLKIIINCINLQLAIRISRNRSFQTNYLNSISKPILRSIGLVDRTAFYFHRRRTCICGPQKQLYIAREAMLVFSVLQNVLYAFLINIFKYCFENYIPTKNVKLHFNLLLISRPYSFLFTSLINYDLFMIYVKKK